MLRFRDTPYFVTREGEVFREGKTKPLKTDVLRGYHRVSLFMGRDVPPIRTGVHRMVAEVYLYRPPGCDEVNHIDNNPGNNNASNLEWCTHSENLKYAASNGSGSYAKANKARQAAALQRAEVHFKEQFGPLYMGIVPGAENDRWNYVVHRCAGCTAELKTRVDNAKKLTEPRYCRACKSK